MAQSPHLSPSSGRDLPGCLFLPLVKRRHPQPHRSRAGEGHLKSRLEFFAALPGYVGVVAMAVLALVLTAVASNTASAAILIPEEALSFWEWIGAAMIIGAGVIEVTGAEA